MAVHIRIDNEILNCNRRFACGIGPELPEGDVYYFASERGSHHKVDCPGCKPHAAKLGTPLNQMTQARFEEIGRSWGYS